MLDTMTFTNWDGITYTQINDDKSPLSVFETTPEFRADTSRKKSQRPGVHPTIQLEGGMEIHVEGALFDDSSELYVATRKAMIAAFRGIPGTYSTTARKSGTLSLRPAGEDEDWTCDCVVTAFSAPVKALYPSLTEFAITLFSWNSWFIGANSGDLYYW